jgi:hypothetical protein
VTGVSHPKDPPKVQPLPQPPDAATADLDLIQKLMRRKGFASTLLTGDKGLAGKLGPTLSTGSPATNRLLGPG